ncbi:MAG: hypothetical protein HEQ35_14035 [Gloeotrichia echinulata IR180]
MGIALLVRTLRERLRSVTRDWGLHFWCGRYANGSAQLPGIGDWGLGIALLVRTLRERLRSVTRDWGLGIGDCTSGADATRSLLPRSGTAPLCYQGLGIGDWGLHFWCGRYA